MDIDPRFARVDARDDLHGILAMKTWGWPTAESVVNAGWSGDNLLSHIRRIGEDKVPRLQPRRLLQGEGDGDAAACKLDEQEWA